jgi:hypothetical protein
MLSDKDSKGDVFTWLFITGLVIFGLILLFWWLTNLPTTYYD